MAKYLFLLGLVGLIACNKPSNPVPKSEATPQTSAGATTSAAPTSTAPISVEVLPFDATKAQQFAFKGALKTGAMWKDKNGDNVLIISQTSKDGDNGKYEEIYAYQYITSAGKDSLLWQMKDWADNYCDQAEGVISDIQVKDLNNDQVAESAFVYNIAGNCDVSPQDFKLMMHSGSTKYAIRGNTSVSLKPKMGGEKNFDPAFETVPVFKTFAGKMWDQYINPLNIKM
jgi:hypothetical protein